MLMQKCNFVKTNNNNSGSSYSKLQVVYKEKTTNVEI